MDLNYVFKRHQISLFLAQHAGCRRSRAEHAGFARGYASQISRLTGGYGRVCAV